MDIFNLTGNSNNCNNSNHNNNNKININKNNNNNKNNNGKASVIGMEQLYNTLPPQSPIIKIGCCSFKKISPRPPHEIYFESRGKCCKKLLRYNGYPNKVLLYPEEGWARNATSSYWTIKPCWWRRNTCTVEEFSGSRRSTTYGRMQSAGTGALLIVGSFKSRHPDPDFKLFLSSNISISDFNMGYCLTGTLERGCNNTNTFQTTHFAVVRRCWPSKKLTTATDNKKTNNCKIN